MLLAFLGPIDLASDPRLGKPLLVAQRLVSLEEALKAASKATGVPLSPAPSLAGRKMCLIADGPSAARVMARVADVLRAEWEAQGKGYRLVQSMKKALQERAYAEAMREGARGALEQRLRALAKASGEPAEDVARRVDELGRAMERLNAAGSSGSEEYRKMSEERNALAVVREPDDYRLGRVAAQFTPSGWEALWRGDLIVADSKGAAPYRVPQGRKGDLTLILRFDPANGEFRSRSVEPGFGGGRIGGGAAFSPPPGFAGGYREELEAWGRPAAGEPEVAIKDVPPPTPWTWDGDLTASDEMDWLHRATGLPVVAEVDRQVLYPRRAFRKSSLAQWRKDYGNGERFHLADGFIEACPLTRFPEPNEAALRQLEDKAAPTLDDYAVLAAATPRGATVPQMSVDREPFAATPTLRFLGFLSPGERQAALGGKPLEFARLAPLPRRAFFDAAMEGVFETGEFGNRLTEAILRNGDVAGLPGLGFFLEPVVWPPGVVVTRARHNPDPEARQAMEPMPPSFRTTFGFSIGDGITYTLPKNVMKKARESQ